MPNNASQHLDIAIVGGGAVGCALALGLNRHSKLSVALIDAGQAPLPSDTQIGFDQRTIALSQESLSILAFLGSSISKIAHSPIKHIHVSDKGHAGQTRLHASEYGLQAFGEVVSLATLGAHLYGALKQSERLQYLAQTQVIDIQRLDSHCALTLASGNTLACKLVVLADGGRSSLGSNVGLVRTKTDYKQTAITLNVRTSEPHNGWAYERFTETGPLAFLPLDKNEFGVVWTVSEEHAAHWQDASDKTIMQALQHAFGYRSGSIVQVSERFQYPLALSQLHTPISHRVVAVGNAAQTLHPIAGQGVNLGFRDIRDLVNILAHQTQDCGSFAHLNHYKQRRNDDKNLTVSLTDTLVRVFSNSYLPLQVGRNLGLSVLNTLPWLKQGFVTTAIGKRRETF